MFKLYSKKNVKRDVESQKRLENFLQNEQEEIRMLRPIVENLGTYDKELGRRMPKEFWIDGRQIRVFLGSRRHDTNYDLFEEILWINYDLSAENYRISHFSGQRGSNKEKKSHTIAKPEEVFDYIKTTCENYFSKSPSEKFICLNKAFSSSGELTPRLGRLGLFWYGSQSPWQDGGIFRARQTFFPQPNVLE